MKQSLSSQLEGVEQILPGDGWEFEQLRRRVLDRLHANGYDLVVPPLADYVESLLSGASEDLDLLTVKAPDHASGRLFGIRADMTPQVARIASRCSREEGEAVRLCYAGPTLLARSDEIGGRRELTQFGAEIFGSSDPESDCEIMRLMAEVLQIAGVASLSVSLGHVGIFGQVFDLVDLSEELRGEALSALQRKSKPDLRRLRDERELDTEWMQILIDLTDFNGGVAIQSQASDRLGGISQGLDDVLSELRVITDMVQSSVRGIAMHLDYSLVGGYEYHTGTVFSAYGPGYGQALAKGGRYDGVLSAYGEPCPATGFSGDLRLLRHLNGSASEPKKGILIPVGSGVPPSFIDSLVEDGERVIRAFPGQDSSVLRRMADRTVVEQGGDWTVGDLD